MAQAIWRRSGAAAGSPVSQPAVAMVRLAAKDRSERQISVALDVPQSTVRRALVRSTWTLGMILANVNVGHESSTSILLNRWVMSAKFDALIDA
jgi:hypothetical protein